MREWKMSFLVRDFNVINYRRRHNDHQPQPPIQNFKSPNVSHQSQVIKLYVYHTAWVEEGGRAAGGRVVVVVVVVY